VRPARFASTIENAFLNYRKAIVQRQKGESGRMGSQKARHYGTKKKKDG